MSDSSFTVPSLNLTSSRSRKNIPTKDLYQSNNNVNVNRTYHFQDINKNAIRQAGYQINGNINNAGRNGESRLVYQNHRVDSVGVIGNTSINGNTSFNMGMLPPRPKNNISINNNTVKQISRNVYLTSQQHNNHSQYHYNNNTPTITFQQQPQPRYLQIQQIIQPRPSLTHSPSQSLLRNPQSRTQISQQILQKTSNLQFKKLDINRALFERKLTKLFQEIQFYNEELNGLYKDEFNQEMQELDKIQKQSCEINRKILKQLGEMIR